MLEQRTQFVKEGNPSAIKLDRSLRTTNYAFGALLINRPEAQIYSDQFQRLDGNFDSQHNRVMVLVPVRDKTLELITDSHDYLNEFNQILSQSTILR